MPRRRTGRSTTRRRWRGSTLCSTRAPCVVPPSRCCRSTPGPVRWGMAGDRRHRRCRGRVGADDGHGDGDDAERRGRRSAVGHGAWCRANVPHPVRRLRQDGLLILLAVFALAEVTEVGVDTWAVLYLRTHLATGVLLGAGAYVVGQLMAVTTRGAEGPLLGRLSSAGRPHRRWVLAGVVDIPVVDGRRGGLALVRAARRCSGDPSWSTVSRLATQVERAAGDVHRGGLHRLGGGSPIVVRAAPNRWVPRTGSTGPRDRLVWGLRHLHPVHALAKCSDRDQRVAGARPPSSFPASRRPPMSRASRRAPPNCARRSGRSSSRRLYLGSNLGAVEVTLAVHRVFDSPL